MSKTLSNTLSLSRIGITLVAKRAVEGAIEDAKGVGLKAEDAASAAATSAVEAAGEISEDAVTAVTSAVSGTISGVRVVLEAPFKKQGKKKH
ncbi:MAG: hypothetical protein ACM3SR_10220, partial [Ignavibacteriales bacterium]